ncbi:MAG: carbon-nitrogen hydrolase family protein [Betaproteobacteria bacterium]|nr:carbon-nitrogen hydrolase family protein [Betaproteobacteria bacterium]
MRIAVAQLELIDGDRDANLARIAATIAAHGDGHDILVLPETCTSGFASLDDVARLAEPLDGPTVRTLQALARAHDLLIVAGMPERAPEGLYNTAVLIDRDGLRTSYRKTHLWLADRDKFLPGERFVTTQWRGVTVAPLICFDIEFPETARAVCALGARLIVVCNGNMDPYAHAHRVAAMARAQDNQCFVAMANRTGRGRVDVFAGGSLVTAPDGRVLVEAGREETVLSVSIDPAEIEASRRDYDYLALRRIGLSADPLASPRAPRDSEDAT